jgi:hypothetical protein
MSFSEAAEFVAFCFQPFLKVIREFLAASAGLSQGLFV